MPGIAPPDPEGTSDRPTVRSGPVVAGPFSETIPPPEPIAAPSPLAWVAIGIAYAVFRVLPPMLHGYETDINAYGRWLTLIAGGGLRNIYARSDFDYPPLFAYLLWTVAKGRALVALVAGPNGGPSLAIWVRIWPFLCDLGIGWLLYRVGMGADQRRRSLNLEAAGRMRLGWRRILPALYLLNPAVLFDMGYWGQTDSIHSFCLLAGFLALGAGASGLAPGGGSRPGAPPAWVAWMLLALAALMKPLALPFAPLFFVLSIGWRGIPATLAGMAAAAATFVIACLPFAIGKEPAIFIEQLVTDLGSMPFTSCNAHNLWWILGPWRPANEPWLGGMTATDFGHLLFGVTLLAILVRSWWIALRRDLWLAEALALATALSMSFFLFSTHMHENHLFTALPLLLPVAALPWGGMPRAREVLAIFAVLTAGVVLNMAVHDPWLVTHGPWAVPEGGGIDPVLRPPVGMRKFLSTLGTALNFSAFGFLVRLLATGPTDPRRMEAPCR
jgi:hypothetical protein